MSIKKLNESIDNLLHEVEVSKVGIKPTFEEELRKSLKETLDYCIRNDRSLYGIADLFADRIESMVPDKRWWEVTDCDFYTEMFNTGDFNSVINCIIDELKPEYKQNVNESYNPEPDEVTDFKKAVNSADTIDDIQFLIYELSDGVAEEACQVAFDNAVNSDENDIDTVKDAVISAIDMYLEDNEFNESYQKDDTDSIKIDDSILKQSYKFKYQLLGRMLTDCSYFLGAGKGAEKFLWAGNVPEQIAYMKAIYNSFPYNKKPEWISLADIDEYEKKMLNLDESLDINDDNFADPLEAAQMSFESGHYAEENDFRTEEDYQKYVEYMDKGPEGFYEEFKDKLDFDPDFVAEYNIEEESLKEDTVKKSNGKLTNRGDEDTQYIVGDGETGSIYNSYDDAKRAYDHLKSRGVDAIMEPVEDISLHEVANPENKKSVSKNTLSEEYDEPELLGKGYAAPTSMDYVSNIKRLVKYKVTDFTDIQNLMQKTMESIDAFDDYWKVHKAAIMKNIKEAQDLIPTEYRI